MSAEIAGGRYRLEDSLGEGAFATVYKATDLQNQAPRAVKLLKLHAHRQEGVRVRFLQEAKAMLLLRHPNVLEVYDVGVEDDQEFLVMALAQGGSLHSVMKTVGPMVPEMALAYTVQLLAGLAVAHDQGIIHRDIKPGNVLVTDGVAMLADFGIARLTQDTLRLTGTGTALGSVGFMAPEQRQDAHTVTPAADVYSVGATFYKLLTGANPMDLFALSGSSQRWKRTPEDLRPFLMGAVSYEASERYPDARAMARAMEPMLVKYLGLTPGGVDPGWHPETPDLIGQRYPRSIQLGMIPDPEATAWAWRYLMSPPVRHTPPETVDSYVSSQSRFWLWGTIGAAAGLLLLGALVFGLG